MKIIDEPRAPNPRRVRIFLAEKGIPMAFEPLSLARQENQSEDYRRLNPFAGVPTLVLDDGTAISESAAICRYFEELQPEPALFGRTPKERAEVEMWHRRVELEFYLPVSFCFRHLHPAMAAREKPQIAAWGEANRSKALAVLGLFDEALAGRTYLAGDGFSIADILLVVAIDFMKLARIARPAGMAALDRWYDGVAARPSMKA